MLACDRCRVAKKKCSKGEPCERCLQRGHECTYTAARYESEVVTKQDRLEARLKTLERILLEYMKDEYGAEMDFSILTFFSQGLGKQSPPKFELPKLNQFTNFFYNINSDRALFSHSPVNDNVSSAQLKIFFGTYVKTFYKSYPFINLKHLQLLFKVRPLNSAILYVIYLIGQFVLIRRNKVNSFPYLEDNYFYKLARYLLSTQSHDTSLINIQALILLADVELQNGLGIEASLHNLQAIRKLQMQGLDKTPSKLQSASSLMHQREKEATWAMAKRTDALIYTTAGIPHTIRCTRDDWEKSYDHYRSFVLIDSMVKRFDRNLFDICEAELDQYLRYLSMELHCFSVFLTDKFYQFKYIVMNIDDIDPEAFMREWDIASYYVANHPLSTIDGTTFNEQFPVDHPQFNLFVSNYLLMQTHALTVNQTMIEYLEGSRAYDYPSPSSPRPVQDIEYFKKVRAQRIASLIQVMYPTDPKRKRFMDSSVNYDYIFALPYFYLYKFGGEKYSAASQANLINVYDYWPCIHRIFYITQSNNDQNGEKQICKFNQKPPQKCGMGSPNNMNTTFPKFTF